MGLKTSYVINVFVLIAYIVLATSYKIEVMEPCRVNVADLLFINAELFKHHHIVSIDSLDSHIINEVGEYTDEVVRLIHVVMGKMKSVLRINIDLQKQRRGKGNLLGLHSECSQGHIIISWDVHLVRYLSGVSLNPRATYIFFIMNPGACNESVGQIRELLTNLWKYHDVLNFLIMHPCSCEPRLVYRFNPFVRNSREQTWGIFHELMMEDVELLDKRGDFGGFPLRASMFERAPTSITHVPESMGHYRCGRIELIKGFRGPDGCVLANIAQYLNFTVKLMIGDGYGELLSNGTFSGTLGDVIYKRAHFAGNARFFNDFNEHIEYTRIMSDALVCFVVPKAQMIPKYLVVFNCYTLKTWCLLLLILIVATFLWQWMSNYSIPDDKCTHRLSFLDMYGAFFAVPMPKLPRKNYLRILLGACVVSNVIISGIFTGSLFKLFSTTSYYPDIDTLEELYASGLSIGTSIKIFNEEDIDIMKKLHTRLIYMNSKALNRAAYSRDVVAVERKNDADFFIQTMYVSDEGLPLLHIVDQCPSTHYLSYIVPKDSPFLPHFNDIIIRLYESGLVSKWYKDVVEGFMIMKQFRSVFTKDVLKAFKLEDVQTAFYFYVLGLVISLSVFIIELYFFKRM